MFSPKESYTREQSIVTMLRLFEVLIAGEAWSIDETVPATRRPMVALTFDDGPSVQYAFTHPRNWK